MMKMTRVLSCLAAAWIAATTGAAAQTAGVEESKYFVDVSVGGQLGHHDVNNSQTFPLYDETFSLTGTQKTGNGAFVEIGGGYRFMPQFAAAIAFTTFSSSATATVQASIPHPLFFDQPLSVTTTASGLSRTERAIHFRAVYLMPIRDKYEVSFFGGPSIVRVSQDLPTGSVAPNTQNLAVATASQSKTGAGLNLGVDGMYLVRPKISVGLVIHYVYSSVDLAAASGVKAGGVQIGAGVKYRF